MGIWSMSELANPPTHFFTQIPHPIHSSSEMNAFLSDGLTSIHSLPILTTGHERLHSCRLRWHQRRQANYC